jgi:hypothetical protein
VLNVADLEGIDISTKPQIHGPLSDEQTVAVGCIRFSGFGDVDWGCNTCSKHRDVSNFDQQ